MHMGKSALVIGITMGMVLACFGRARGQDAGLDERLAKVKQYKLGQDRRPLDAVQEMAIKSVGNPQQRAIIAAKLAGILNDPDATFEAKDFACRQLYMMGTAAEVPAVAKLLGDEKLSHMARYVLERMEDPAAAAALREGLKTTGGKLLVGVINSIGNRRDAQAVGQLAELLGNADTAVASAAASALGKIDGPEALAAIRQKRASANEPVRGALTDAYLRCADDLLVTGKTGEAAEIYRELHGKNEPQAIRMAALRGLVAAEPEKTAGILIEMLKGEDATAAAVAAGYVSRAMPGEALTRRFVEASESINGPGKAMLIEALGFRGDKAAAGAVRKAAESGDEEVRVAALRALGSLGDAADVKLLADAAAKGGRGGDAARESLAKLHGMDVDSAIAGAIQSSSPQVQTELIKALSARGAVGEADALVKLATGEAAEPVRLAAIQALGALGSQRQYGALVKSLISEKSGAVRNATRDAMASIAIRMNDRDAAAQPLIAAMSDAQTTGTTAAIGALSRIGGQKALEAVRAAMKDPDAAVQNAAMRAIVDWPDASAIPDMMNILKSGNETQKILALRGLRKAVAQGNQSGAEKLAVYREMLAASKRPEEKKQVLAGLADLKDAAAIEIAAPMLEDPELKNEAGTALVNIARAIGPNRGPAKAALQKVISSSADESVKKQAQDLLKR